MVCYLITKNVLFCLVLSGFTIQLGPQGALDRRRRKWYTTYIPTYISTYLPT